MPSHALNPGPRISALLEEGEWVGAVAELRAWGPALDGHRDGRLQLAPRMVALASDRRLLLFEVGRRRRVAVRRAALYYAELGAIGVRLDARRRGVEAVVTLSDPQGHRIELGAQRADEAQALVDHVADRLLEVAWQRDLASA